MLLMFRRNATEKERQPKRRDSPREPLSLSGYECNGSQAGYECVARVTRRKSLFPWWPLFNMHCCTCDRSKHNQKARGRLRSHVRIWVHTLPQLQHIKKTTRSISKPRTRITMPSAQQIATKTSFAFVLKEVAVAFGSSCNQQGIPHGLVRF